MAIELLRPFGMEFIPTFGYALEGVAFGTFIDYVRSVALRGKFTSKKIE